MRNFPNKYSTPLLIAALLAIIPATTHAAGLFGFDTIGGYIETFLAYIMNILIDMMSILVAISGYLLNFSMNLTLHIKSFVDSTPAIFTTWRTIRDISGLCMIFFLLYAAFQLITGLKRPNFGDLIKNIVVAGILINFSFFITGLGIDASNIISVQLYNAIAPKNNLSALDVNANIMNGSFMSNIDGGLADIFMNHLHIQSIYNNKIADPTATAGSAAGAALNGAGVAAQTLISGPVKVILMGAVALIIEFAAAMSFGAAAIAFIFRFVVLLLLLAFSPIMALGFLPEVGAYSKKWSTHYWNMLIFMPIYLLLMYVALSVLTTSPIFGNNPTAATVAAGKPVADAVISSVYAATSGVGNNAWYSGFIVLGVNAVIVIVLLNMPLAAAASMAGGSIGFLKKAAGRVGYDKWFGMASGYAGAHTLGKAATGLDKAIGKTKLGNTLLARDIRGATTGAVAKSKYGGERSFDDYKKEAKITKVKNEEIDRRNTFNATLDVVRNNAGNPTLADHMAVRNALGKMSEKEKLGLGEKNLKDPNVIRHLKKSDFEAIKKSEDLTESEKEAIAEKRKEVFEDAINTGKVDVLKDMIKTYSGEELLGIDNTLLDDEEMLKLYTVGHLKSIDENSNDRALKGRIRTVGLAMAGRGIHVATEGWLRDMENKGMW